MRAVVIQYMDTVRPMHKQFIEPTKRKADVILRPRHQLPAGGHHHHQGEELVAGDGVGVSWGRKDFKLKA